MSPKPSIPLRLRLLAATARDLPPATVLFILLSVLVAALGIVIALKPVALPVLPVVPQAVELLPEEPQIRVRIVRRDTKTSIESDSPIILVDHLGEIHSLTSPISISILDGSFSVSAGDGVVLDGFTAEPFTIRSDRLTAGSVRVWAMLRVHPAINSPDRLDVIAHLPIERYLPGVLAGELLSAWPIGAFRAQAVASRSYALHEREFSMARGRAWDLESNTRSQTFLGETSLAVALDAVSQTRGQVLLYEDRVLRAYYSASIGGRAASAANVFRSDTGYEFNLAGPLQATVREYFDEDSPTHRWERQRGVQELSDRIRAWGKARQHPASDLGRLVSIVPASYNPAGRPRSYTLEDRDERVAAMTAEQLRIACNYTADLFPALGFDDRVLSGDLEMVIEGRTVRIQGRGFGHGVGLCQYSAAYLASNGEGYAQILARYYPEAELIRWYE